MNLSFQLLITTLSKATHSLGIFVLSIILARYFTKDEYGTYLHVQLISNFCVWAFLLGIPHSVYYFFPRVKNKHTFIFVTTLMISILGVITASTILNNIELISELLSNPSIIKLAWILFFLILFQVPLSLFEPMMITASKVKEFSYTELIFNLGFFLSVVIPVYLDFTMIEILQCLVLIYAIQSSVVFYNALRITLESRELDSEGEVYTIKNQMKYSLPIGLSMGVMEASRYTDKIIVSNQASVEEYAEYTRGAIDIPVINIIANTLDNLMMPKFVKAYKDNDTDGILSSWHSVIRMMAAFIYPCCLFLICSADLLIPALFSDKYTGSVIIFQIYTLGLLTRISTFNVIIRAIGKTKVILYVSIFTIISNILLTYYFMSLWGLIGAPIATVITLTVMRFLYLVSITHYLKINISRVFPWYSLFHSLIAALIASIPVVFILNLELNVWLHLILLAITYGVVYLAILRKGSALNENEKTSIRGMLPSRLRWLI